MSPDTFLERLSSLVPREREHTILYRGTLGPNAARRAKVVPPENPARPTNLTWATLEGGTSERFYPRGLHPRVGGLGFAGP